MKPLKRIFFIFFIFFRYNLSEFIFFPVFSKKFKKNSPRSSIRLRQAFERLGPLFIKFGQVLSTRPDLLPEEFIKELSRLQDTLPPFPYHDVKKILETTYDQSIETLFHDFNKVPLASASVAQVHEATLFSGEKVVVKILRPRIKKIIQQDIRLLYKLSKFANRFKKFSRFKPIEIVAEFERTLMNELDLRRESANASYLRKNFLNSELAYIPKIYWEYTKKNVMVLERIHGHALSDLSRLRKQNFNFKLLAEKIIELFFTEVFDHNFFHADMHPGNIFVAGKPEDPHYILVDFGIMGSLSSQDQRYLAENLLAFFKRDYRRVAELHLESGWIASNVRIEEFEAAMRTVCEPLFGKALHEISFGQLLLQLIHTAQEFHIIIQPQLLLIQKTLLNVEGLARQLHPKLDLLKTAKPFVERWMKKQLGFRAFLRKIKENLPYWAEKFPDFPDLIYLALQKYIRRN